MAAGAFGFWDLPRVAVVKLPGDYQGHFDEPAKVQVHVDAGPTDPRELCKVFMRLMADEGMMGEWRDMVRGIVLEAHAQLSEEAEGTGDEEAFRRFTGHQVAEAILPPSEPAPETADRHPCVNGLKL